VVVAAAVAKEVAVVAQGKVVAPPVVVEARVVAAEKALGRLVVGRAQPAILLAVAGAMRLRQRRSSI
jgi:hypothetical protein